MKAPQIEFVPGGRRIEPPEARLPGRYKGKRHPSAMPVQAECPCGAKSRPMSAERAEQWYQRHLRRVHPFDDLRHL